MEKLFQILGLKLNMRSNSLQQIFTFTKITLPPRIQKVGFIPNQILSWELVFISFMKLLLCSCPRFYWSITFRCHLYPICCACIKLFNNHLKPLHFVYLQSVSLTSLPMSACFFYLWSRLTNETPGGFLQAHLHPLPVPSGIWDGGTKPAIWGSLCALQVSLLQSIMICNHSDFILKSSEVPPYTIWPSGWIY